MSTHRPVCPHAGRVRELCLGAGGVVCTLHIEGQQIRGFSSLRIIRTARLHGSKKEETKPSQSASDLMELSFCVGSGSHVSDGSLKTTAEKRTRCPLCPAPAQCRREGVSGLAEPGGGARQGMGCRLESVFS